MKLRRFVWILLLTAACAPAQPYRSGTGTYGGSTASGDRGNVAVEPAPANSYSKDAVECERKAAFAGIGSKGEAFASCMRARGHTPGR